MTPTKPKTPDETRAEINKLRVRLIEAIGTLSPTLHSATRSRLEGFVKHLNPSAAKNRDSEFPITVRAHPFYTDRTSDFSKPSVLLFLVGNAVLAYYDAVSGKGGATWAKVNESNTVGVYHPNPDLFRKRVEAIEAIAITGYDKYVIEGNDRIGYTLVTKAEAEAAKKKVDTATEKREEERANK